MSVPPPLPKRQPVDKPPSYRSFESDSSRSSIDGGPSHLPRAGTIHLTPYAAPSGNPNWKTGNHPYSGATGIDDPRSSSTQSLQPAETARSNQRKLLLIYIHGFMGAETSFQSFPAHVHSLLAMTLSETHVVHSKIYPRYPSRKNISFARDKFSNWLTPHEGDDVDVVLLGHSLGGILASEIVLLPSHRPAGTDLFQHRILGQIAFDVPFLGMHPGVVSTGIASLFKPSPEIPQPPQVDASSTTADPNYNPAYPNDITIPVRTKFDQALRFVTKHYGDLTTATSSYFKSYLEFGGCLADYQGLKKRYEAIRSLEDVNELAGQKAANGRPLPRVRFVNYYTASTGRIKKSVMHGHDKALVAETEMTDMVDPSHRSPDASFVQSSISQPPQKNDMGDVNIASKVDHLNLHDESDTEGNLDLEHVDPMPTNDDETVTPHPDTASTAPTPDLLSPVSTVATTEASSLLSSSSITSLTTQLSDLPPPPPEPIAPPPFDPTTYSSSPDTLKIAQKDHARQQKAYSQAVKDREKAIKDREKLMAKREKALRKAEEKQLKQQQQDRAQAAKEKSRRQVTLNQDVWDRALEHQHDQNLQTPTTVSSTDLSRTTSATPSSLSTSRTDQEKKPKIPRDRKFCTLPSKDTRTGQRDKTWIRVYMENMDEVVAHTSLFNESTGETYAKLVGDTVERIEGWVREDLDLTAIKAAMHDID